MKTRRRLQTNDEEEEVVVAGLIKSTPKHTRLQRQQQAALSQD